MKTFFFSYIPTFLLVVLFEACNKIVQVPNPINSVTASQIFSSNANANSAIAGIYSYMSGTQSFLNSEATFCAGESADELTDGLPQYDNFLSNTLTPVNNLGPQTFFWTPAYFCIYNANAAIDGLQNSSAVSVSTKNQLTGEAKFIRALCYFYLTNFFGDLPLDLTPDFNQTVLLKRSKQVEVYQQIVSDLQDAQSLMSNNYTMSGGMPIRANKWAATALLARVHLYQSNWGGADSAASAVINSGQYSLDSNLLNVFLMNSQEAILQLQTLNTPPFCTFEAQYFIPPNNTSSVNLWLTSQLVNAFEPGDLRWTNWVDSTIFNGTTYYYPYKYQSSPYITGSTQTITENYMVLRYAEQYLILAEAQAQLGGSNSLDSAVANLNVIRARAHLPPYSGSIDAVSVQNAIHQEKRIEFFAEWGHRWLDLHRWRMALGTLDTIPGKIGNIDSSQLLYPIPLADIQVDPNLSQNPGYQTY